MIIVRNEKLVQRNHQIGKYSGILSIAILGIGMFITIRYPEQIALALLALIVGFVLSQIGLFYSNRFGRSPRPDEQLDAALKGLDDQYALYHYQSPVDHLLVGPAGVWMLLPMAQKGKIVYQEKKQGWKMLGGSLYRRLFAQDSLGNPAKEMAAGRKRLTAELEKIPELEIPDIRAALVFTDPGTEVDGTGAPVPTLHARQLKKMIRKESKTGAGASSVVIKTIQDYLGLESNR